MKAPPLPKLPVWTVKDFAREMGIAPRWVRRWWKKLGVPPDRCARNACHRWSPKAARKLMTKWRGSWAAKGWQAAEAVRAFAGQVKRDREKRQLTLPLFAKEPPPWSVPSKKR